MIVVSLSSHQALGVSLSGAKSTQPLPKSERRHKKPPQPIALSEAELQRRLPSTNHYFCRSLWSPQDDFLALPSDWDFATIMRFAQ